MRNASFFTVEDDGVSGKECSSWGGQVVGRSETSNGALDCLYTTVLEVSVVGCSVQAGAWA